MIYHYIMIYYGYILSGFPNDERVEPCRPRRFPSSLLFLVPSFSGFIMFHLIPFSKKKHSPCPLCWAWASWWGNPAEHPKLQRDREICFPCLPCTASVELASTKLQLCSKELQRSAIGSGCSHETGGRSAVSLEVCDHQCVCACVRELHCRFCILLAQQWFRRGSFGCLSGLSLLQFASLFVREA